MGHASNFSLPKYQFPGGCQTQQMPTYHANVQYTKFPTILTNDIASAQIVIEVMPARTTNFERNPANLQCPFSAYRVCNGLVTGAAVPV